MSIELTEGATDRTIGPPRPVIEGPSAWIGAEQTKRSAEWIYPLTPAEIGEIERAAADLRARGLDLGEITRRDFPLPTLGPKLETMRAAVIDGRGFVMIRGLPVDGRKLVDNAAAQGLTGKGRSTTSQP